MFRVHIGLRDFYDLKPYLRKTKTKMRILSKKGFPFWCHRHPRLKWMLVAALMGGCIFAYSFNFIWDIEIHGNQKIATYELMDFLKAQEIEAGIKKEEINCPVLEYQLRQTFQDLGWVSVYINHTKLCIEIKESLYDAFSQTEEETGVQYDLVAARDAVIYSIVTRRGTSMVQKGQQVRAGETLVLGQCEIYDDAGVVKNILRFTADAEIYGDTRRKILIPLSEMELLSLKLTGNYNDTMLFFIANEKIDRILAKIEENGVIILDKNVMIDKEEKNIVFICEITTREQIGINIPVEEQKEYEFE